VGGSARGRLLKGRANPTGNRACLRKTSSLDLTRGVFIQAAVGNDCGKPGT